jgi:hypothetical protein
MLHLSINISQTYVGSTITSRNIDDLDGLVVDLDGSLDGA